MSYVDNIRRFLEDELMLTEAPDIDADENLLISGLLDSLSLMRLIAHLEDRFDLDVPPQEITLENFASLAAMSDYLIGRLAAGPGLCANDG